MADFEAFAQAARNAGFDQVLERQWPPHAVLATHTHPFDVQAQATQALAARQRQCGRGVTQDLTD